MSLSITKHILQLTRRYPINNSLLLSRYLSKVIKPPTPEDSQTIENVSSKSAKQLNSKINPPIQEGSQNTNNASVKSASEHIEPPTYEDNYEEPEENFEKMKTFTRKTQKPNTTTYKNADETPIYRTYGQQQQQQQRTSKISALAESIKAGTHGGGLFPTQFTLSNLIINGVPFKQIPIIHIKCTKNNTKMTLTDYTGKILFATTAGANGFKNSRKSTTIAAQSVALSVAEKAKRRGIQTVRVIMNGLGPGRQAGLKAIQTNGFNIVSLTDETFIPYPGFPGIKRPPAVRRI